MSLRDGFCHLSSARSHKRAWHQAIRQLPAHYLILFWMQVINYFRSLYGYPFLSAFWENGYLCSISGVVTSPFSAESRPQPVSNGCFLWWSITQGNYLPLSFIKGIEGVKEFFCVAVLFAMN
jgi:hypothetical protein